MMIVMEFAAGGTLFDLIESRAEDQVNVKCLKKYFFRSCFRSFE